MPISESEQYQAGLRELSAKVESLTFTNDRLERENEVLRIRVDALQAELEDAKRGQHN